MIGVVNGAGAEQRMPVAAVGFEAGLGAVYFAAPRRTGNDSCFCSCCFGRVRAAGSILAGQQVADVGKVGVVNRFAGDLRSGDLGACPRETAPVSLLSRWRVDKNM